MDTVNVLVLDPNPRVLYSIRNLPQDVLEKHRFIYHNQNECSSLQDCLEHAEEIVRKENIKVVLPTSDNGALVKAALVQEFSHLRGLSVESVFLTNNKYYTRCFLDPQPIPFASLDLTATNLDQACEEALEKVGTPAFFKPGSYCGSVAISSIHSANHLKKFAQFYISNIYNTLECSDAKFMNSFYSKYIEDKKYPLARKSMAVLEKHMGNAIITNSDSYVADGKIYHWSIFDHLYSQIKPRYYLGAFYPTRLSTSAQQKIWNLHDAVVHRMIDFGFNNDFVNVETFLPDSGEVKLVEVNPRQGGNLHISGEVFRDGNIIEAQLKLAQGVSPKPPVPNGRFGLHGFIRTCGCGTAKEFYNFSNSTSFPQESPDQEIDGCGESGADIGQALVHGNSYEEVMEKYWSVCRQALLKPELSVWK